MDRYWYRRLGGILFLLPHFQIFSCFFFSFFFLPLKKVCLQTEILGNLFKYIYFCFILLFTSSSPCHNDQFAFSYFSTSWIVLIQVYNWEIRHHSLVCCCGLADILYVIILRINKSSNRVLTKFSIKWNERHLGFLSFCTFSKRCFR